MAATVSGLLLGLFSCLLGEPFFLTFIWRQCIVIMAYVSHLLAADAACSCVGGDGGCAEAEHCCHKDAGALTMYISPYRMTRRNIYTQS